MGEMKVLINAAPLIFLAKARLLRILKELFGEVYTTQEVWDEVVWPLEHGFRSEDAEAIASCDRIRVLKLSREELRMAEEYKYRLGLDRGEASLASIYRRGFDVVVVADRDAMERLRAEGISVADLSKVIKLAARRGLVDATEDIKRLMRRPAPGRT